MKITKSISYFLSETLPYQWRLRLGLMPIQPCMMCGKWFWGGLPRWWWIGEDGKWGLSWQASWCDYCSRECADEDLDLLKEHC